MFNPLLLKLIYETVKITQETIFFGLSDLCVICEGSHPLINTENYISYESSILLLTKDLKILQDHKQFTRCEVKNAGNYIFTNISISIYASYCNA